MDIKKSKKIVYEAIKNILDSEEDFDDSSPLIGENAILDSMKLVELCLELEDKSEENDFEFDWQSKSTLSRTNSIFRSIKTLSDEFFQQSKIKK